MSVGGLFSATRSFRGAGLEPQEQRVEELLVPRAGWLPLGHAQPLREAFSNTAQPAHSQATAPRITGTASPPTLQQNLGTRLLMVTNDVCGVRVWPRVKMPLLRMGILPGLQASNPRAQFVSLWSITTCVCNITEAWQMPLSAGNGNLQQLSSSCLSPRKFVQKLMAWDI